MSVGLGKDLFCLRESFASGGQLHSEATGVSLRVKEKDLRQERSCRHAKAGPIGSPKPDWRCQDIILRGTIGRNRCEKGNALDSRAMGIMPGAARRERGTEILVRP